MQTASITGLISFLSLLFIHLLITNLISKQREMEDLALVQVRARALCFLCIEFKYLAPPPLRLLPAFVNRDFLNPYGSLTAFNFQLFATWLFHYKWFTCKFSPFITFYPSFNGSFLGLIMFICVTFGIKPICY